MAGKHDIFTYVLIAVVVFTALVIIIAVLYNRLSAIRKEKAALQNQYNEQRMKDTVNEADMLKNKLNPHLLKNALNAIQSHAYQSYYALDKLSNVLDYILYESDGRFVSLKDELEFALNLIEINRLKTSPLFDLTIKNKIDREDPVYSQALIAPFISINPIENAFKHADLQSEGSFISVVFEVSDNWFLLSVSNKIAAKPIGNSKRGGLGNKTFHNRLNAIYQDDFKLEESADGDIYITILKIRLRANDT